MICAQAVCDCLLCDFKHVRNESLSMLLRDCQLREQAVKSSDGIEQSFSSEVPRKPNKVYTLSHAHSDLHKILALYFAHTSTYYECIKEFATENWDEDAKAVEEWRDVDDPQHIYTYPCVTPMFFVFPADVTALSTYLLGKLKTVKELAQNQNPPKEFPYNEMETFSTPNIMKCLNRIASDNSKDYVCLRDRKRKIFRTIFYTQIVDGRCVEATCAVKVGMGSTVAKKKWLKYLSRKESKVGPKKLNKN